MQQRNHIITIGASDTHKQTGSANNLGEPSTIVYGKSLSKKGILNGLKSRRAYISALGNINLAFNAHTQTGKATIGETLQLKAAEKVTINLSVKPMDNATITLISNQGILFTENGTKANYEWTLSSGSA